MLEFRRQYRAHRMTSSDARFGIVYHPSFTYHAGTFSLFSEPRIHSIILYICSTLTSQSPRAFARVPVPTRVNEGDTFILTQTRNHPLCRIFVPRVYQLISSLILGFSRLTLRLQYL